VHNCECKHKVVKYCANCKTIYCKSCKREWYDACTQSHTLQWNYTFDTAMGTEIKDSTSFPLPLPNLNPQITWESSSEMHHHQH